LLLGIDQFVIEHDLEHSTAGRDKRDFREGVLELSDNLIRQTDGSRSVSSFRAKLDGKSRHDGSLVAG
jgi:hypothetical protein